MRWFIDKDTCTNILKDEFLRGLLFWRFLLIPQIRPKKCPPPKKKGGFTVVCLIWLSSTYLNVRGGSNTLSRFSAIIFNLPI